MTLAYDFENLCAEVIERMGFDVKREVRYIPKIYLDIVAEKDGQIQLVVEVKLLPGNRSSLAALREIVSRTTSSLSTYTFGPESVLLILSGEIEPEHKEWLETEYRIKIWGSVELRAKAAPFPDLTRRIESFLAKTASLRRISRQQAEPHPEEFSCSQQSDPEDPSDEQYQTEQPRGDQLAAKLKATARGNKGAKSYEDIVREIIQYLFGMHLLDPRPQNRLEGGLSVLDVVFRVSPGHPFWDTLTRDFRARVIVFECKNYNNPIKPAQLYSTERYISIGALRPICFIVSRLRPHTHTELAAAGAMREGGKLFVFLDDGDLCEMLRIRDAQLRLASESRHLDLANDPTVILDQKIYDFLGRLPR